MAERQWTGWLGALVHEEGDEEFASWLGMVISEDQAVVVSATGLHDTGMMMGL